MTILNSAKELRQKYPRRRVYLVMEGDYGGQVFLTVPLDLLGPNAKPKELLRLFDEVFWNEPEGARMYLQPVKNLRHGPFGGMGGGKFLPNAPWVHEDPDLEKFRADDMALVQKMLDVSYEKV
jgi:hypothetical protein